MTQPNTVEEAVEAIRALLGEQGLADLRKAVLEANGNADKVLTAGHHSFGRYLRNELNLWQDKSAPLKASIWGNLTKEKQNFYTNWWKGAHQGPTMHADDASHELFTMLVNRLII